MSKNNKKKHLKNRNLCLFLQYLCLFLPYIIIIIVKKDVYFNQKNTISMSIGCIFCIIIAAIVASKKIKLLKGIGGFVAVFLISFLMDTIIQDLTIISFFGGIGFLLSLIFESIVKKENKYLDAHITKEVFTNEW